jgi:hypothetical protein
MVTRLQDEDDSKAVLEAVSEMIKEGPLLITGVAGASKTSAALSYALAHFEKNRYTVRCTLPQAIDQRGQKRCSHNDLLEAGW